MEEAGALQALGGKAVETSNAVMGDLKHPEIFVNCFLNCLSMESAKRTWKLE